MIETYRGFVDPHQEDVLGHMNVTWYTAKFDEASWHLFTSVGLSKDTVKSEKRAVAALEAKTKFMAEVSAGELLYIKSGFLEVSDKTVRFQHIMYKAQDHTEVASVQLLGVHMDLEKRKAIPIPQDLRAKLEALLPQLS
ncbi:bifunctional 3-hydroxyacyl-CoA dehydrogenase/thioesterase [Pseudovibrio axinellae]|uniref:Bifunctional 3-hydroxyacyl-CoA dehydrogenase/thioesterase n=1 Tax=Pseudovibrio axinellae TaxID=989403 RepID=A0A165WNQ9_9HYPH|nr:thioesterase family protein [Pseudovibrio axinellae]KZL16740.1 bifunctional 3-hydroxyacyl-CoA dehydrogenase/thioesterase [Pseudovibrio axinellae]SEQ76559.1 (3S)-malyl-CoA thioesterase [Pseudovibrio axinellae]